MDASKIERSPDSSPTSDISSESPLTSSPSDTVVDESGHLEKKKDISTADEGDNIDTELLYARYKMACECTFSIWHRYK